MGFHDTLIIVVHSNNNHNRTLLIDFDTFCTVGNRNEYSIKQIETVTSALRCL